MNPQPDRICAVCGQRIPATAKLAAGDDPARTLCLRCQIAGARPDPEK